MKKLTATAAAASLIVAFAAPGGAQTSSKNLTMPPDRSVGETVYNQKGQNTGSIVRVVPNNQTAGSVAMTGLPGHVAPEAGKARLPESGGRATPAVSGNDMNWLQGGGG